LPTATGSNGNWLLGSLVGRVGSSAIARVSDLNAGSWSRTILGSAASGSKIDWGIEVTGFPILGGTITTNNFDLQQALPGVPGATVHLSATTVAGISWAVADVSAPCGTAHPPFVAWVGSQAWADAPPGPAVIQGTTSGVCLVRGGGQALPQLPVPGTNGFCGGASGNWFDPPLALGYDFQQSGSSLFTDILTLPVGIDGDGMFEVLVGNQSLGQFAEGTRVNFVQLLGNGVPAFRIVGIDPAADATDVEAFPVQLAFDTPTADFTMTPVKWRAIGTSCSDAVCASCPTTTLEPIGDALEGNLTFGLGITNGPANGAAGFYVGLGSASPFPIPLFCGSVLLPLQTAFFDVGATLLPGSGTCDGAGSILLPLVPTPPLFGLFLTVQAITLCPQGGLGLTHAIEFPIGT